MPEIEPTQKLFEALGHALDIHENVLQRLETLFQVKATGVKSGEGVSLVEFIKLSEQHQACHLKAMEAEHLASNLDFLRQQKDQALQYEDILRKEFGVNPHRIYNEQKAKIGGFIGEVITEAGRINGHLSEMMEHIAIREEGKGRWHALHQFVASPDGAKLTEQFGQRLGLDIKIDPAQLQEPLKERSVWWDEKKFEDKISEAGGLIAAAKKDFKRFQGSNVEGNREERTGWQKLLELKDNLFGHGGEPKRGGRGGKG